MHLTHQHQQELDWQRYIISSDYFNLVFFQLTGQEMPVEVRKSQQNVLKGTGCKRLRAIPGL